MVRQFFHRQGPKLERIFDQPARVFVSYGTTAGTITLVIAARDILGKTNKVNILGAE